MRSMSFRILRSAALRVWPRERRVACAAAVNGSGAPNCVPWNIWTPGGVTPAALAYMSVPSTYATTAIEYITDASVTGDLGKYGVKSPLAARGMNVDVSAPRVPGRRDTTSPPTIFSRMAWRAAPTASHLRSTASSTSPKHSLR